MSPQQPGPKKERRPRMPRGKQPRKPFGPLYGLICLLVPPIFRLAYGLRIDRSAIKGIRKPVLVLCNHQSNLDFLVAAAAAWPLRLNVMTSTWFYNSKSLARLLDLLGGIPKKQFLPDTAAIKSAMKVIARGDSVGLFPEGQVCYSGMNCDIDESIGKLIKKLGVTTVNLKIRGNHLTWPKWALAGGTYHGRVSCTAEVLFTGEEIADMPLAEVTQKTLAALRYDEYAWQREHLYKFRPKLRRTDGLQVVLHRCAACGAEFATATVDNELFCERCGYRVAMDRYGLFSLVQGGRLVFGDPAAWYRWQASEMKKEMRAGRVLPFESPSVLYKTTAGKHGYSLCGDGAMTLTDKGLFFVGQKDGAPFETAVLYDRQTALAQTMAECAIDIPGSADENYGFSPLEHRHMMYIVDMYTYARRRALGLDDPDA